MEIELTNFSISSDIYNSVKQIECIFGTELIKLTKEQPAFEKIKKLFLSVKPHHPFFEDDGKSRSYSKKENFYFVSSPIDYTLWATSDWSDRVDTFANALNSAIDHVAKSRITAQEKQVLTGLVEEARGRLRNQPLENLEAIGPTHVEYDEDSKIISYGFSKEALLAPRLGKRATVPADQIHLLKKDRWKQAKPQAFKLYKSDGGRLYYSEAWLTDQEIIEHWGSCGDKGKIRKHKLTDIDKVDNVMKRLKEEAREKGFRPISSDRHATLVVEYTLVGFGGESDLGNRHLIEDYLSNLTGWLGLGDCDGGSIGSGTMEIFCNVIDYALAKEAIEEHLKKSPFGDFNRIYCME